MSELANLNEVILQNIEELPDKKKREVLNFIEYLKIREDQAFIEYVNERTKQAVAAKRHGKQFKSLETLQSDYA
ncbi:MAG: DUF2281 domain-containing protein [Deltaproteobacteria bacterium]|nr:DUF2281 domain-containing protein [Deltaproteobacteria bacterium]